VVDSNGQLYTIEGIAAGLIMLATAYLVVNATSIYTPGDTHISDMQLEVLGSDALAMMNTAPNGTSGSPLAAMVENEDSTGFRTTFLNMVNNRTGASPDNIQFMANVSYVKSDGTTVDSTPLAMSRTLFGGEHAVHVSEWVIVDNQFPDCHAASCSGKHAILVEVLLWRD
jgi:hypothetical protein